MQSFVECVTINGRPFAWLMDSGFQKAIEKDMQQLKDAGQGISFSNHCEELKKYIRIVSEAVRLKIKSEVREKFVSLQTDITTKNRRGIMTVSVQYMHNGKLRKRTIGMIQLKKSHTGQNLTAEIECLLVRMGICKQQIISTTVDNGSNVVKMVEWLNAPDTVVTTDDTDEDVEEDVMQLDDVIENCNDDATVIENLSTEQVDEFLAALEMEEMLDAELNEDDVYKQLLIDLGFELSNAEWDIICIRCAAHTLQLAVWKAIKSSNVMKWILLGR